MAAKLHSQEFVKAFKELLTDARKVQIASAWMSENGALEALLRHDKCKVQAIIGVRSNNTTLTSLSALIRTFGWNSLRIADPPSLFHPKVILFHYKNNPTVAWIGSANFTQGGMGANVELMLQTDDKRIVGGIESWFSKLWRVLPSDTELLFTEYSQQWTEPTKELRELGGLPNFASNQSHRSVAKEIRLIPAVRHSKQRRRGKIEYGPGDREPYISVADGLRKILIRLSKGREDTFFSECLKHPSFRRESDKGSYFVVKAQTKEQAMERGIYYPAKSITALSVAELGWTWWISEGTHTKEKWEMVKTAAEIAQIPLHDSDLDHWPDEIAS